MIGECIEMARRNTPIQREARFELFVERMKHRMDGHQNNRFDDIVRKLLQVDRRKRDHSKPMVDTLRTAAGLAPAVSASKPLPEPQSAQEQPAKGRLPARPDFDSIESAARHTVSTRTNFLALIGLLVFSWSNNESLLIYVLMVLLRTDEPSAAIVFSTLNTTRARLELVDRLAQINVIDRRVRVRLNRVIESFNEAIRIRNEFLHATYKVNSSGEITHTQIMRLVAKKGGMSFGQQQPIDQTRLDGIVRTCGDLRRLNREIWDLLPQLKEAVGSQAALARVESLATQ
jgi:hypothetical protein